VTQGLFSGLKVVDCASFIAGPAAATVMSDYGAEVIKIEPPGAGDPYRFRSGVTAGYVHHVSPNWEVDSRNKKSLALNLAHPDGRAVLRRLVAEADVFITNFPPRVRRALELNYSDLGGLNPRLIYASFTGFGETGPDVDKPGFDATVWWARTGLMHLMRAGEDTAPVRSPPGMGDHPSAMALYAAIATALYQRERTGRGGMVGSSLLMNGLWANACSVQQSLCGETVTVQPEREKSLVPLRNCYRCSDGRWLILSIVPDQKRWEVFCSALNSKLLDDERFATVESRGKNPHAMIAALDTIFATKTQAEWSKIMDAKGVIFGIVADMDEIKHDEQARISGALVPFAGDDMLTVSSPFWIDGHDKIPPRHAPGIGEHSDEVLSAAGYSKSEIENMRAAGVVG
jgi:formyl-CoA transferase